MDFSPFIICEPDQRTPRPRPINTPEGLGDRMRTAAFAELQATQASAGRSINSRTYRRPSGMTGQPKSPMKSDTTR